jgi:thiosulfate dehydrogenase [quinone] large subunit
MRVGEQVSYIEEPKAARWLFGSSNASPIWLVVRLWLGYEWLSAGWDKVFGDGRGAWMESSTALKGFVAGAIEASTQPDHPRVAYAWWVDFLGFVENNTMWISKVIAVGELLLGLALLLGLFTGIAAFLGLVLNLSFVFSGAAGVNPAYMVAGILLVLAWRNAGYLGVDRTVLPALGTPWHRGELVGAIVSQRSEPKAA